MKLSFKRPQFRRILRRKKDGEIDHYVMLRYRRKMMRIPVDRNGYVPLWCIAEHFQRFGSENDMNETSTRIIPKRCTPKEIADWWADPSSCDIEGVDTVDSDIYDTRSVPPEQRHAQRRIAVLAEPEEQKRIRKVLSESFTADELEKMARNGSFIIRAMDDCGNATGCYFRRQDGVEIPMIVIEKGCTPDGIVHEVVHHLRAVDPDRGGMLHTPYPQTKEGKLDSRIMSRLPKRKQNQILRQEERLTVAETVARTGRDPRQSGYYDGVPDISPRKAYLEDRRIFTGTPPNVPDSEIPRLKGKAARDAVMKGYAYSNIAKARILEERDEK